MLTKDISHLISVHVLTLGVFQFDLA